MADGTGGEGKRGTYLGTTIGGAWWRRYTARGFSARGNGRLFLDARGLRFRRKLFAAEVAIPWQAMTGAGVVTPHAGQWLIGRPILRIDWTGDGRDLSSGFYLTSDRAAVERLAADIVAKIGEED